MGTSERTDLHPAITAHHPACPGVWRHRVVVWKVESGGRAEYAARCSVCGWLPTLTIYETPHAAWLNGQGHEHDEPCPGGKCIAQAVWDD